MRDSRWERLAPATGIVFVVLTVVAGATAGLGTQDAAVFFVESRDRVLASSYLFGLSMVFFMWFLGSLRSNLRRAEGGSGRLSAVAFGGGLLTVAALFISGALNAALAAGIAERSDPGITRALYALSVRTVDLIGFWLAVLTGAAGLVMLRSATFPSWLGWFGAVVAVGSLVGPIAIFVESGPFASAGIYGNLLLAAFLLWVLLSSVILVRGVDAE